VRLILLALLLAGCASVQTPSDALGAAYIAADAVAVATHQLCGNEAPGGSCAAGARISTEAKDLIRDKLVSVNTLLNQARALLLEGEEAAAMDSLTRARFILRTAESLLQ
jgi:hypothetical protein